MWWLEFFFFFVLLLMWCCVGKWVVGVVWLMVGVFVLVVYDGCECVSWVFYVMICGGVDDFVSWNR